MNPEKPKYVADLPREWPGHYIIIAIALVLAIAIYGALKIYAGTVDGWDKRFNRPAQRTSPVSRSSAELPQDRLRELEDARSQQMQPKIDRCIDGVAFRRLPDGGWENLPGVPCP